MRGKKILTAAAGLLTLFALWTAAIMYIDVQKIGPEGTGVGFAGLNGRFHALTGVNWLLYTVTDWLGLVPVLICGCYGVAGLVQWIRRKKLLRVDADILLLGAYYLLVIFGYLFFEMVPVNYRPVLIDGYLEASYPSSTTLLVLSVMPTLKFQTDRRACTGSRTSSDPCCSAAACICCTAPRLLGRTKGRLKEQAMEFHEKLQELRKSRSLTQEELAEALFVSRTAVSKWESGRGYPGIDSLKEIARFFSVTVDELICPEEIISAAENEKKDFVSRYLTLICGVLDLLPAILLFIPAFGNGAGSRETVALSGLDGISSWIRILFIIVISLTVLNGICAAVISNFDRPVWNRHRLVTGIALTILGSALFLITRQPYAGLIFFAVLVIKGFLILKVR